MTTGSAREVVLGLGGLLAVVGTNANPSAVRTWAGLGTLTDAGDLAAAIGGVRRGEPSAAVPSSIAATGLAVELWAFRSAPPARPDLSPDKSRPPTEGGGSRWQSSNIQSSGKNRSFNPLRLQDSDRRSPRLACVLSYIRAPRHHPPESHWTDFSSDTLD